ncbi:hypothetical protein GJ496_005429 [Pomphorhynchus laevis]|nr:hypothetical protein GJ496_005429 [Pomphorhynchus laevis]
MFHKSLWFNFIRTNEGHKYKPNLTLKQRSAILKLRNRNDIVIHKADKATKEDNQPRKTKEDNQNINQGRQSKYQPRKTIKISTKEDNQNINQGRQSKYQPRKTIKISTKEDNQNINQGRQSKYQPRQSKYQPRSKYQRCVIDLSIKSLSILTVYLDIYSLILHFHNSLDEIFR